jgi:hypothetical protein
MAELSRDWPEHFHDGELSVCVPNNNVVMWVGLSKEGADVIKKFIAEQRVEACEWMAYLIDGSMLSLPIVKRNRTYKKPHWLPIKLMRLGLIK